MQEPLRYRAQKWLIQRASSVMRSEEQHERLQRTDWDALVVMDACRADTFREVTPWAIGECRSPGSSTDEWLSVAEDTGIFEGTRIVTANSQYARFDLGERDLRPVWETDWHGTLGTVLPEPVLDGADDLLREGDVPVVAHLLQPHAPYIARLDGEWIEILPDADVWKAAADDADRLSPQVAMARGEIDTRTAARGYRASVRSVWDIISTYVSRWVKDGRTVVVTSDHGETFGRPRDLWFYAHPYGCHIRPLVEVPYLTFKSPREPDRVAQTVEEKLRVLGYRT